MSLRAAFLLCSSGTSLVLHAPVVTSRPSAKISLPVTLFLLLVFDLMLFALDSSASRANGKSGWNTKRGNVLQLFLVLMKHIGLSGLLF